MGEAANKPKTTISGRGLAVVAANHYSGDLRAYLSRKVSNRADVDDVAQSVFLKLIRINNDELIVDKPFGFLRLIAKRAAAELCASCVRDRDHIEVSSTTVDFLLEEEGILASDEQYPGEHLDFREEIEKAIAQLSPTLAAVLILIGQDELSYAEAAARLDMSEHAVKKNLQRARAQLRRLLFIGAGG